MKAKHILLMAVLVGGGAAHHGYTQQPSEPTTEPLPPAPVLNPSATVDLTQESVEGAVSQQSVLLRELFGINVQTSGAVPMAIRSRQPWQLINPLAPTSFGDGLENVSQDPETRRATGFSIFAVDF